MVGVPGKYKGCETCRRRRVKCSNERPQCKKCMNSGRDCEGYERARVFITGTLETKGRVASHPRKSVGSSGAVRREEKQWRRSSSRSEASSSPNIQPSAPYTSAWDDFIPMSDHGREYPSTMMALHTKLQSVQREHSADGFLDDQSFTMSLPPYKPYDLQPSEEPKEFTCEAQYLRSLGSGMGGGRELVDSYFVFLYEHNFGAAPIWNVNDHARTNEVRRLGPSHFQEFPHHHFFARVYRPLALSLALLSRQETFLAMPEWTTKPWEQHPKSLMDQLVDVALFLPSLLARADEIQVETPTTSRRDQAKELLQNCLSVVRQFDQWLVRAIPGSVSQPVNYWPQDPDASSMLPFAFAWAFKDGPTGVMFLYFWMTQIVFHRCITTVHAALFEPVLDVYQDVWPPLLPPSLQQMDLSRYQQTRELGANICRGLDAALAATRQPDLLLGPLRVATELYREINSTTHDAMLELMWLEGFGERIRAKGQHVTNTIQGLSWLEVGRV